MPKLSAPILVLLLIASCFLIVIEPTQSADSSSWMPKASMPTARSRLGAAVVCGEIYAIGGDQASLWGNCIGPGIGDSVGTCEKYDPTSDTWTQKASMPTARCGLAVAVYNNEIYCIGGFKADRNFTGVNEVYNPQTDVWQTKAAMPTPRMDIQAHVVAGKIYLIGGGTTYTYYVPTNEVYDPQTDTWSTKTPCPYTITSGASAVVDGKIYFLVKASVLDLGAFIAIYDPANDQWSTGGPAPLYGSISAAACAVGNEIVFLDEYATYIYSPATDIWTMGESNPAQIGFPAIAELDCKLYVIGGIPAPFQGYIVMTDSTAYHSQYTPSPTGPAPTDEKIYIKPDGNIEPATPNITSADKVTYTFTGDVYQRIVVQKDNIVINGNGYTIFGQSGASFGISLFQRNNVEIANLTITQFQTANIGLEKSTNIFVLRNTLSKSVNNGIRLYNSSNNAIMGNIIVDNKYMSGIQLMDGSNNNDIVANTIQGNALGIYCFDSEGNNIYHNNFLFNGVSPSEVIISGDLGNNWDNGSPFGGNFWAEHNSTEPYVINQNNQDHYPLAAQFDIANVPLHEPVVTPTPTRAVSQEPTQNPDTQHDPAQIPEIQIFAVIALLIVCIVPILVLQRLKHKKQSTC